MSKNKKIYFGAGAVILLALSLLMIVMTMDEPQNGASQPQVSQDSASETEETESNGSDSNDNVTDEPVGEGSILGDDQFNDDEIMEYAEEAVSNTSLTSSIDGPRIESFREHALLRQNYLNLMGQNLSEEDEMENEADWSAKELNAWIAVAEEETGFTYSEDEFMEFVNEEGYIEEDDQETRILLHVLSEEDDNLYTRQLEYLYMRPFVWQSVKPALEEQYEQESDESDEEYEYRLYLELGEAISAYLDENHPELMQ
ncbi:hypothetical protein MM300_03925 [Evansella sp. LMS18]|uniref:hypothetical protein n=1 Tax=Evansella sp. LMS18 TaxID=2924033 RepID=UPI0020D14A43|nr:hypothetical protein [Evansella sp. LMS18]UTR11489.1 hypothetical protein MM300_03925 [Evansella sp. LMS18]